MIYICVRTYGNGYYQNKIFPQIFKNYEKALDRCDELNKTDTEYSSENWIPFAMYVED